MTIEELKNRCRSEFSYYIRPLVIKDKCEICGCNEKLEVHHDIQFSVLLKESMKELTLYLDSLIGKKLNKEEQQELIKIVDVRIDGKQLKSCNYISKKLSELDLNYTICSKRIKKNGKLNTAWVVSTNNFENTQDRN